MTINLVVNPQSKLAAAIIHVSRLEKDGVIRTMNGVEWLDPIECELDGPAGPFRAALRGTVQIVELPVVIRADREVTFQSVEGISIFMRGIVSILRPRDVDMYVRETELTENAFERILTLGAIHLDESSRDASLAGYVGQGFHRTIIRAYPNWASAVAGDHIFTCDNPNVVRISSRGRRTRNTY